MTKISRAQIECRAYFMWLDAGCPEGEDNYFWYKAEEELDGEHLKKLRAQQWATALMGR